MANEKHTPFLRELIESILLGPMGDRRQLQDSPILGDVWLAYAMAPRSRQKLLITPVHGQSAGAIAARLDKVVTRKDPRPEIGFLQGVVSAKLSFDEVLYHVVPWTKWWHEEITRERSKEYFTNKGVQRLKDAILRIPEMVKGAPGHGEGHGKKAPSALDRYAALAGIILWAKNTDFDLHNSSSADFPNEVIARADDIIAILREQFVSLLTQQAATRTNPHIFQVSLNRPFTLSTSKSIPAVKADAATMLFNIDCSKIAWAIVDSGIDGGHPAFVNRKQKKAPSRVCQAFDFSRIGDLLSFDNVHIFKDKTSSESKARLKELVHGDLKQKPTPNDAIDRLLELARDAEDKRPINWGLITPFIEINTTSSPSSDHGTHVAGILGASVDETITKDFPAAGNGMCPDIQLYDFRILAPDRERTEFAIIAALQYIRYLNQRNEHITIHGANLSLSILHEVRNYACGRTPVCVECERLVDSGTVVVAAAGNRGYHEFETRDGPYAGYAAFSITDPGNADGVITVGSTHRSSPHTYGVSFFSSRGPTGDGRPKPDLVAPGERINAPFRDGDWGDLDGTSMAAPHVSGAAAMLMARYPELRGQPRRIKQILCESATDLGRERSFQGNGMLDVLRALQKI